MGAPVYVWCVCRGARGGYIPECTSEHQEYSHHGSGVCLLVPGGLAWWPAPAVLLHRAGASPCNSQLPAHLCLCCIIYRELVTFDPCLGTEESGASTSLVTPALPPEPKH